MPNLKASTGETKYFSIFRKILDLEGGWCEQALQRTSSGSSDYDDYPDYDDLKSSGEGGRGGMMVMNGWFRTCEDCLELVEKAWLLHQQILALEPKYNHVKGRLRNEMRKGILEGRKSGGLSGTGKDANIRCEVFPGENSDDSYTPGDDVNSRKKQRVNGTPPRNDSGQRQRCGRPKGRKPGESYAGLYWNK